MAKAIPKKGSCGRIGSRKSTCKIPKGVIHIQASFIGLIRPRLVNDQLTTLPFVGI